MEGLFVSFYALLFAAFALPAAVLEYTRNGCFGLTSSSPLTGAGPDYLSFRNNYVLVNSLMMAGDWLQGPYVYHLYESYGFEVRDIGRLFIMGFGGSAVFGTIAGSLADKYGRKLAGLVYVASYCVSCLTKHSRNYWMLMAGRLLGGVSTSLLFSAFESWVVAAHNARGFDPSLLGDVFTKAVFMGNGLMAIAAGLLGNFLVEDMKLGPVAPFDAAIVVLLIGGAIMAATWEEHRGQYGDGKGGGVLRQLQHAVTDIMADERIALLGAMQALFEASMYTFIFLWTPALSPHGERLPHGFVFAIFMTASMVGSAWAGMLMERIQVEDYMQWVFWASAVCLAVPVAYHTEMTHVKPEVVLAEEADVAGAAAGGLDLGGRVQLLAFCAFEVLIGIFWPSMMTMRSVYVPEEARSTIINVFRIPLNAFVCIILWKVSDFPLGVMFGLCAVFLGLAALCQARLAAITSAARRKRAVHSDPGDGKDSESRPLKPNGAAANGGSLHESWRVEVLPARVSGAADGAELLREGR